MTSALATISNTINMWEDDNKLSEIRKLFAPKLTDMEFQYFVGLGKATGLNPFLKEIWAVKYGKDKDGNEIPAQVFIGRDGYRKAAQAHAEYDYHQSDAVYENDKFEVINGEVRHAYTLKNRGELIGAYCVAKRHKSSKPQYVFADLKEYSTGKSLWHSQYGKPATMIKKVAESQCLRAAFQDLLGGTYGDEEMQRAQETPQASASNKSQQLMDKIKSAKGRVFDAEKATDENETGEVASPNQLKEVHALIAVKGFNNGRLTKAMKHYKVETLGQLTKKQADDFISQLNKLDDK